MTKKNYSDREKLQLLLNHWLQHNKSHSSDYLKWADVARQGNHTKTAEFIEQAAEFLKKSDKSLEKALESVGDRNQEHQLEHHHHHHHD